MAEGNALLLVLDGVGFNRQRAAAIVDEVWSGLPDRVRGLMVSQATSIMSREGITAASAEDLAKLSLYPIRAEALPPEMHFDAALQLLAALEAIDSAEAGTSTVRELDRALRAEAARQKYVPWAGSFSHIRALRNHHLTMPTSAAGVWAGFEKVDPPVQGNSETGHQQIANLRLAPQTPLEITRAINDGRFFRNEALCRVVQGAVSEGRAINFCFLLSGVGGADGRVHSAWNHLEAFLAFLFEQQHADPALVRMQAILDGRDSPSEASIRKDGGVGDYLSLLSDLLGKYDARESLAWVVGRSIAMDRDFREGNTRADYLLMTQGEGRRVRGFEGVRQAIAEAHGSGHTDADVPPIAVLPPRGEPKMIERGQAFVDLNFRPDRQRAKIAALAGARSFLSDEAKSRGRAYSFDWMGEPLDLDICTISDYHPVFAERHRVKVAFPTSAQPDNLLSFWSSLGVGGRYMLVAESNKSAHMGYFIRGRREEPAGDDVEDRKIIPSFAEADGIRSDSDFFKTPQMKNMAIADLLVDRLSQRRYRLICANFSNCDMIGHLLPDQFDAAVKAYETLDATLARIIPAAAENGYSVIITADHGNIEDDTPSHSINDVLTTITVPRGRWRPARRDVFQARLFDVSWTIGRILGVEAGVRAHFDHSASPDYGDPFVGRPLVDNEPDRDAAPPG